MHPNSPDPDSPDPKSPNLDSLDAIWPISPLTLTPRAIATRTPTFYSPRLSCRTLVILLSLYGMWLCPSDNEAITLPSDDRDLLIFLASSRVMPAACVLLTCIELCSTFTIKYNVCQEYETLVKLKSQDDCSKHLGNPAFSTYLFLF